MFVRKIRSKARWIGHEIIPLKKSTVDYVCACVRGTDAF